MSAITVIRLCIWLALAAWIIRCAWTIWATWRKAKAEIEAARRKARADVEVVRARRMSADLMQTIADKISDVERLNLKPGDALAFIADRTISHDEADQVKRYVTRTLPEIRCIIVAGATLQVISQQVADEIERAR